MVSAATTERQLPLKFQVVGTYSTVGGPFGLGSGTATGHTTLLGRVTYDFAFTRIEFLSETRALATGAFTLTGANGKDSIRGTFRELVTLGPSGSNSAVARYTITGGTGRFSDASGRATAAVDAPFTTPTTGTFTLSLVGTISTPHKGQK